MGFKHYYTIYEKDTDTVVAFGSSEDCQKMLKCSKSYFYCLINRNRNGKNKTYNIVIEPMSEDDD